MKIKLLADYRGVLTGEEYYTAGTYAVPGEMPEGHAAALVAAGRAVEEQPAEDAEPPARRTSRTKRQRKAG